jgi:signal transduction histidine kinase/ligand-binding sensor domain-containing protein/DNA-binding response OmpR family regulator
MLSLIFLVLVNPFFQDTTTQWPYQHLNKKDGLSNSSITSIYMDRYDYVWFGSWDGLNRYDGTTIKVFKPDAFQKGTISNNIIRDMLEDRQGNFWIVTHRGLNRYERDTESFRPYLTNLNGLPFYEYNTRAFLGPDSAIWVTIVGGGVSRYQAETDSFVPLQLEGLAQEWLKNVAGLGSSKGIMYLLGNDGKLIAAFGQQTLYAKQLLIAPYALKLYRFFQLGEAYYLALTTTDDRLYLYDLANMELPPQELPLLGTPSALYGSKDTTALWVGTESGNIFKVHRQEGSFEVRDMAPYFPLFSKEQRKILAITETKQGLLWIGTDGDGVAKFLTRPGPFFPIPSGDTDKGYLSNSIVRSVYEDPDGILYIGTRGGGLNIITPGQKETAVWNTQRGLSNNAILSLNKDAAGNLWIGADGEGIDMIEANTNRVFHFPEDFENAGDLSFGHVYTICRDVYGALWLGTSGHGVVQLAVEKTKNGRYRLASYRKISNSLHPTDSATINSNVVYAIVEEMPNMMWFGTRGAGIYRYNTLTHQIEEHISSSSPAAKRLSNDDVLSLYIGSRDQLWIGTSGGINRISLQGRPYQNTHFTHDKALANNTIHSILEDNQGMLWLSTNSGLILFDPRTGLFKTYDANDGLLNNEFTDGAAYKPSGGEKLFFGGINGLDVIYPAKQDTSQYFPKLAITHFYVHNKLITASDSSNILGQHIDLVSEISLAHTQNFISLHFTTLDYWNKHRIEYGYFLENFDQDWNYIQAQQGINLTNMPRGDYKLLINYKKDGVWNPHPRTLAIRVRPPWWHTPWAYAAYGALLLGAQLMLVLYIRQRGLAKRAASLDQYKMQQLKELNDYKLQFFTNIAHEFRTPLTLILGPVASLIDKTNSVWEKSQLKTVYGNSLRLQKLIEELLQFRKIESGKEVARVSETELVCFTREIVETFSEHALAHEVQLEFTPEEEQLQGWVDVQKLEKILINLISNAIKYNEAGGWVKVLLQEQEGWARFTIKDSGQGIDPLLQENVFEAFYQHPRSEPTGHGFPKSTGIGLSLTKRLVELHQGRLQLESWPGKGTVFTLLIPIRQEAYVHSQTGTPQLLPATDLAEQVSQEFTQGSSSPADSLQLIPDATNERHSSLLIVDDNPQIIILLQSLLADHYHTYTAGNGKEALHILEKKKIDLVISDIVMPIMDGLSLCTTIKDNIATSHIPVILLTAKAEIEYRIEGLQVGADSYIPKPFHPEHLFVRIEKLIQNREQIRERFSSLAEPELGEFSMGMGVKDDEFMLRISRCIQTHLSNTEFTAEAIAEEVGMSKASLYKKVKALTNLTPHGLIKQYRLKKAAELLLHSGMNVSEVIYETGFNSRSYFYKSFNETYHCHPKDFGKAKAG